MSLPPYASEASRKRYALAMRLAESCPPELADEIALTGSTVRGWADDESDLELNLWSESVPPAEARAAWLAAAGVEQIEVTEQPRPDESYWIAGRIGDVPLEVGWQTYKLMDVLIANLLAGREKQRLGDILVSAIPLCTQGRLPEWQARLSAYSDLIQERVLGGRVKRWKRIKRLQYMYKLSQRDERLRLTFEYVYDLNALLSLLYAINRHWHPDEKWQLAVACELPMMPLNWRERFDAVLTLPPVESFPVLIHLLLDALALVPAQYNKSETVQTLQGFAQQDK